MENCLFHKLVSGKRICQERAFTDGGGNDKDSLPKDGHRIGKHHGCVYFIKKSDKG